MQQQHVNGVDRSSTARTETRVRRVRQVARQSGFLLVESLVAILIIGSGVTAAIVALSTASIATGEARQSATAAWVLTSQVELIKSSPYVVEPATYPTITPPAGFTVQNSTSAFPGGDGFIQDVQVDVYQNGILVKSVQMVKVNN